MINSVEAITHLLQGTILAERQVIQLAIPESTEVAFAIAVNPNESLAAWNLLRSYLPETGRWPLFVCCWSGTNIPWDQMVIDDDLFSRFFFAEEATETSPEAIMRRSESVNLNAFLEQRVEAWEFFSDDPEDAIYDYELDELSQRFGHAPTRSQINNLITSGKINNRFELERWLFDWEQAANREQAAATPYLGHLNWFNPDDNATAFILLPTANSWESLAYINFYGGRSAEGIVLLKKWYQQHEAELVCHYGTMLQFIVGKLPESPEAAFTLAWEQVAIAPCTVQLPGVTIRDHARALLYSDRWFLHQRP